VGLSVISGSYFSNTFVRPQAGGVQQASRVTTDEEKVARFNVLIANAGKFEVHDSTMVFHYLHAKSTQVAGTSVTRTFRMRRDTLWITAVTPWAKDSTKRVRNTVTLVRER